MIFGSIGAGTTGWYTHDMGIFRPAAVGQDEAREMVETKLRWILSACVPEEVWLFGSAERGEMTEASDVDLALVFPDGATLKEARRSLYARPRPDVWAQDIAFFISEDFYHRGTVGGLPMLILQEGKRLFRRGDA